MAKLLTIKRKDDGEIAIREHSIPGYTPEELNEITLEALVVSLVCCINKQADGVLDAHALLLKVFEKADGMLHSLTRNALSDEDIENLSEVIFNEEP